MFPYESGVITAWGSMWSGKEYIIQNGKVLSQKRSFSKRSVHSFSLDENELSVVFRTENLITGRLCCCLIENGVEKEKCKGLFSLRELVKSTVVFVLMIVISSLIISVVKGPSWSYYLANGLILWWYLKDSLKAIEIKKC